MHMILYLQPKISPTSEHFVKYHCTLDMFSASLIFTLMQGTCPVTCGGEEDVEPIFSRTPQQALGCGVTDHPPSPHLPAVGEQERGHARSKQADQAGVWMESL